VDFSLSPEQEQIRATFHGFAEKEIRPLAQKLDEAPEFPRALFRRAGELGFFGMRHPAPWGTDTEVVSYVLAVEELAWGSLAVGAICTMQSLMGTYFVRRHAPDSVRERLMPAAMAGEKVGTICMTEPDAGSDLFGMKTRAEKDGDGYRLTGQKTWITSAPVADFFTVLGRTGEKTLGVFLVERGAPGLAVGRGIDKMGVRASLTSEVFFENTPAIALGDTEQGTKYLREILAEIRVMTAALSLGVARAAYEDALRYAAERKQFGKSIDSFQAVQAHLADMATELEAARRFTHWAAWRSDQKLENAKEASMAKLFASETAARVTDRAARVLASYGFAAESPVARYLRDVRFVLIGGGTSEILRVNIAKELRA
jgi:alkylation response protein AidB-like acyl-CoA dehydrogenase